MILSLIKLTKRFSRLQIKFFSKWVEIFFQYLDFYRNFAICNLQFAFYNSGLSRLGIRVKIRIQIGIRR